MIAKSKRKEVHAKYSGRCAYCGEEITYKQMQVDHIIPQNRYSATHKGLIYKGKIVEYDKDDLVNLNPACRVCNLWKSTFLLGEFRIEVEAQVDRLRLRSSNFRLAEKYGLVEEKQTSVEFYFEQVNPREI